MEQTKFSGVADTLFIPLAARVMASQRFPYYFKDDKALEFADIPQVIAINQKSSEYTMLASVARYYVMDKLVQDFLIKYPHGQVICLGAGLETMNYRLARCDGHFYQVDFPQVIENRRVLLGQADNETFLPYDITDPSWTDAVDKARPVLLVASGVFQYFKPEAVSQFLSAMEAHFLSPLLLFDATNSVGLQYAEKYVRKTGNKSASMYFCVDDIQKFCESEGLTSILSRGFFQEARNILKGTKLYTKIAMQVVDKKKRAQIFLVAIDSKPW